MGVNVIMINGSREQKERSDDVFLVGGLFSLRSRLGPPALVLSLQT